MIVNAVERARRRSASSRTSTKISTSSRVSSALTSARVARRRRWGSPRSLLARIGGDPPMITIRLVLASRLRAFYVASMPRLASPFATATPVARTRASTKATKRRLGTRRLVPRPPRPRPVPRPLVPRRPPLRTQTPRAALPLDVRPGEFPPEPSLLALETRTPGAPPPSSAFPSREARCSPPPPSWSIPGEQGARAPASPTGPRESRIERGDRRRTTACPRLVPRRRVRLGIGRGDPAWTRATSTSTTRVWRTRRRRNIWRRSRPCARSSPTLFPKPSPSSARTPWAAPPTSAPAKL